ncbi:MAG TPA: hypothetical protein DFS52_06070 [Myxococcales bacterium]|jgi:hypothetical protein|nr:hypothetical protein [Myxococcales bacterium]
MAKTAQFTTTEAGEARFKRLMELGVFEGVPKAMALSTECRPLIEALHHVLAGGKVSVTVESEGAVSVFEDLQDKLAKSVEEANSLNAAGTLVASP